LIIVAAGSFSPAPHRGCGQDARTPGKANRTVATFRPSAKPDSNAPWPKTMINACGPLLCAMPCSPWRLRLQRAWEAPWPARRLYHRKGAHATGPLRTRWPRAKSNPSTFSLARGPGFM